MTNTRDAATESLLCGRGNNQAKGTQPGTPVTVHRPARAGGG